MRWIDRVYGEVSIDDPSVLAVIESPTFRRLRGVRQAGPSAIAFPFKNVTRFEHSLGVHHLLKCLDAGPRERMAGLLHDISHTAFSHAVDFLITSDEQDHHEGLKPVLLRRPDLARAIKDAGFRPEDFFDDSRYPLLERPLPWLCADRLDYFLRDGLACGEITKLDAARILDHLDVEDSTIVLTDVDVARRTAALFADMNRKWWASPTEAFVYNEFADALREGLRTGILREPDLLSEDDPVLARLYASGNPLIAAKLASIRHFEPSLLEGYAPRVIPKQRWLDPPVKVNGTVRLLSELA